MKIKINNQEELNNINLDYNGEIIIVGGNIDTPIIIDKHYEKATVILIENSVVVLKGSSQVKEMYDSSQVKEMYGSSQVN